MDVSKSSTESPEKPSKVQNENEPDVTKGDLNPQTNSSSAVEFEPPVSIIKRLLKQSLPANAIISKDALSAITRACGIFIIYITACANDCARESKRSTISANDILAAIKVTWMRLLLTLLLGKITL